ncbi:MAG: PAS domain S-box protein [Chitinophagaceae bacterium]
MLSTVLENERLNALYQLNILDTEAERDFDDIVQLAAQITQTPISLITLVDDKRQWFKAKFGLEVSETPREVAFCAHAIQNEKPLIVTDASIDPRFFDNPLVTGDPNIRFYTGLPISTEDGYMLGTLCVIDREPKILSNEQMQSLQMLRNQVNILLRLRTKVNQLKAYNTELNEQKNIHAAVQQQFIAYLQAVKEAVCIIGINQKVIVSNKAFENIINKSILVDEPVCNIFQYFQDNNFNIALNKALKGTEQAVLLKHPNQAGLQYHLTFTPVVEPDGTDVIAVACVLKKLGVTVDSNTSQTLLSKEHQLLTEALEKKEQAFDNIFRISPVPLLLSRLSDGKIVKYNKQILTLTGFSAEEIHGKYTIDFYVNKPDRQLLLDSITQYGYAKNLDIPIIGKKGIIIDCLASVTVIEYENEKVLFTGFTDVREQKKAAFELWKSEQKFKSLADNIPGVVYQLRVFPDGSTKFDYISEKAKEVFHLSNDLQSYEWQIGTQIPQEDQERFLASIQHAITNCCKWEYEGKIICGDGSLKWFRGTSFPVKEQNDLVFNGLLLDITPQKEASNLLSEQYESLRKHTEQLTGFVYKFVKEPNGNYKFIYASEQINAIYEVKPEDVLNDASIIINERLHKDDYHKIVASIEKSAAELTVWSEDYRVMLPKKGLRWLSGTAKPEKLPNGEILWYGYITDITDKKKIEAELLVSQHNLETIFENTSVGYLLLDTKFNIVSSNSSAKQFSLSQFGLDLIKGNSLINYFPTDMQDGFLQVCNSLINGESIEFDRQIQSQIDNQLHWYHIKYTSVFDDTNQVIGYILSFEDITERKKGEIDLQRSFDLVNEQNKRLLNFSYIVSHNLRSHTSNIKSIVNLLDVLDTEEEKTNMVQHLKQVANSLDETLYHLNEVVAIQNNLNVSLENLKLRDYIVKAILVLKDQIAQKQVIIHNEIPDEVIVKFNPAYLESIVLNLLSNAIKYAHPKRQAEISFRWFSKENVTGIMHVSDNGKGIDLKRHGDKLFGMYKTFHGNPDARGIGLFICKNQVDAMGGKIEVESEPFVGTTFKITFK